MNRVLATLIHVLRYRRAALAVLLLALGVSLAGVPRLTFDADINRAFVSDTPRSQAQQAFENRPGGRGTQIAILVETDGILTPDTLLAARNLALDLEFVPGLGAVASPFSLRFPPWYTSDPDAPIVPVDLARDDIPERLTAFKDLGLGLPTFLAHDALLILATADPDARALSDTLAEIDTLLPPLAGVSARATVTGEEVVNLTISAGLAADLALLNILGACLVALLGLALLRCPRLAVIAVLPAVLGAGATLGLAGWLGYPITMLSNVIPLLMLVLGVANGLHLTVHLAEVQGAVRDRVEDTLRVVGPASALTAITTALAFGAIMITTNVQLREFAILGAAGMILTLVIVLLAFALLAVWLAPAPNAVTDKLGEKVRHLAGLAIRTPRATVGVGMAVLLLSGVGFAATTSWFPLHQNLPADSPVSAANDRIAEDFGGIFQLWVEMPEGATWAALSKAVEAVEAVAPPDTVLSELALARWSGDATIPPDPTALARLSDRVADQLRDEGTLRFAVASPEPMRNRESLARHDTVERAALEAGAARVIGLPATLRHDSVDMIGELSVGLLLASALGAVLVAAAFRRLRLIPTVLIANLLPVLSVGAALHLLTGGLLTPPAVLSLTIAFGIAIDDTIHFLNRYYQAISTRLDRRSAAAEALRSAGGVMVLTTALLCAGLAVTASSTFFPVRLFGMMLGLSLLAALLCDLILLPALLLFGADDDT